MYCPKCGTQNDSSTCSGCGTSLTQTVTKRNNEMWGPCPHCNSENVEQRGTKYYFQIGILTTIIFIVVGFFLPALWLGTLAGIFFMAASGILPKMYFCKDCKKAWK